MDINRFTEKAQSALRDAQALAVRMGQQQIDVEHVLLCSSIKSRASRPRFWARRMFLSRQ